MRSQISSVSSTAPDFTFSHADRDKINKLYTPGAPPTDSSTPGPVYFPTGTHGASITSMVLSCAPASPCNLTRFECRSFSLCGACEFNRCQCGRQASLVRERERSELWVWHVEARSGEQIVHAAEPRAGKIVGIAGRLRRLSSLRIGERKR